MSTEREEAPGAAAAADAAAGAAPDPAHGAAPDAGGGAAQDAAPGGDDADAQAGGDDAARLAGLESQLAEAQARLAETEAQLQRTQADFANYRRRMMQEQQRWGDRAMARLAADLLPVVDNLERALAALEPVANAQDGRAGDDRPAGPAAGAGLKAFAEGIRLTLRQFLDILAGHGIRPIEAVGRPFDPHFHEAVGHVETDAVPEEHVAVELQRGYTFKDEVLRPALVQVARRPAQGDADVPPRAVTDEEDEEDTEHGQGRGH